jgi:hypothetical protein
MKEKNTKRYKLLEDSLKEHSKGQKPSTDFDAVDGN